MSNKSFQPHLRFFQVINMTLGALGMQFGLALQTGSTPWILFAMSPGPNDDHMFWIVGPAIGLLVQPIIGYYSDRTWHSTLGRRRPYIAIGALLASASLIVLPDSSALWMFSGLLWIIDASVNMITAPFRGLVGDMLPPSQRTSGFAMQTFFVAAGAILATLLPWILESLHDSFGLFQDNGYGKIPPLARYSLYIGGGVLFIFMMYTIFTTKEYPPTETTGQRIKNREIEETTNSGFYKQRFAYTGISLICAGVIATVLIIAFELALQLYILAGGLALFGIIHIIASLLIGGGRFNAGVVNMVRDFHDMPSIMVRLAFVQFFSWFALWTMHSNVVDLLDVTSGITSWTVYYATAAIFVIFLPMLTRSFGKIVTHLLALVLGGLGIISFYFIPDSSWLAWLSLTLIGISWGSILTMPYAILANGLPSDKMGYYMGTFNMFIVIPQIIAGACSGAILRVIFHDLAMSMNLLSGSCMILAGLLTLAVKTD